jgi:hypothetical protein
MRLCIYQLEKKQSYKVLDNNSFYTIAEGYNYNISAVKYLILETKK